MSKSNTIKMEDRREKIKTILIVFAGCIMAAHGLRMIYQGIFWPNSYYPAPTPSTLDFWFDWTTLLVLGIIIFYFGISSFYHSQNLKYKANKQL